MTNDDASPISPEGLERLRNATVFDTDGDKIGPVEQIYVHDTSGRPSWASVRTGLFRTREALVPLDGVDLSGAEIHVPFSKDVVKDAPKVEADDHISRSEESELHAYYRGHGWNGDDEAAPRATGSDTNTDTVRTGDTDDAQTGDADDARTGATDDARTGVADDTGTSAADDPREAALSGPSAPPVAPVAAAAPLAAAAPAAGRDDEPVEPSEPSTPQVPDAPETPQTPEPPTTPEAPEPPLEPLSPLSPSTPSAPEAPSAPGAPSAPEGPLGTGGPTAPNTPTASAAADTTGTAAADEFVTPGNSTLSDSPVEPSRDASEFEAGDDAAGDRRPAGFGTAAVVGAGAAAATSPAFSDETDDETGDEIGEAPTEDFAADSTDDSADGSDDDGTWTSADDSAAAAADDSTAGPDDGSDDGTWTGADDLADDSATGTDDIPDGAVTRGSYETPYPGDAMSDGSGGRRISAFDEVTDGGYSIGSAAPIGPGVQPMGHPVRAWEDTKTFRAGAEGDWEREPDVWFMDEQAAANAGFRPSEY